MNKVHHHTHQLRPNDIKNIEINLPNLETQKKIGKFLSDIENKIKINNKINDNLDVNRLSRLVRL
ncbi:restriction endonuclease subunit S [Mycoplasmopsis canis]|uniref:restriction endonuclease subunit S n=1 Tax=Mycoplasmopsis canis TaxID=29555 RepID=UPI002FE338F5